jgi:hypothetical protein
VADLPVRRADFKMAFSAFMSKHPFQDQTIVNQ